MKRLTPRSGQTLLPLGGVPSEDTPPRSPKEGTRKTKARCSECRGAKPAIDAGDDFYFCSWDCASLFFSYRCCPRCRGTERHRVTSRCTQCDVQFEKDDERAACEARVQRALAQRGEVLKTSSLYIAGNDAWEIPQEKVK